MVQAQGLPQLDPYRTLQLDPRAPRELVVEAYWALVRRARRHLADAPDGASRVDALNAAYASVMTAPPAGSSPPSASADYYAVLCIDASADAEIIDMAHAVLATHARRQDAGVQRDVLDEAHRTLSHPQRRAAYDATRDVTPREVDRAPASGWSVAPSSDGSRPLSTASLRPEPSGESKRRGLLRRRRRAQEHPGDERVRALRDDPAFGAVIDEARRLPLLVQANGTDPDAVTPAAVASAGEAVFVSGPRAGECVTITDSISIAGPSGRDGKSREMARLWQHDGRFFLSQTGRGGVRVGGRRPAMELVVLDDGDEIEIGPNLVRFRIVGP